MRLAISNIAWPAGADAEVVPLLREHGVEGVELALTKVWPEPLEATGREVCAYRDFWESRGLRVVAFQALLFGKPGLTVFGSPAARRQALVYLKGMIALAARLGGYALVFGSPKNRLAGGLTPAEAEAVAVPFFRELGDFARDHGAALCIEPNPVEYGCDFVTRVAEGIALVDAVGSHGFGLHLDAGGMRLSSDPEDSCARAGRRCRHFHVSEPFLKEVGSPDVPHAAFARSLRRGGYDGWVSVEMNEANLKPTWREGVARSLAFARSTYLEAA